MKPTEIGIVVALGVLVAGGTGYAIVRRSSKRKELAAAEPVRVSPAAFADAAKEAIASGEAMVPSDDSAFFVTSSFGPAGAPAELPFTGTVTAAAPPRGAPAAPAAKTSLARPLPRGAVSLHYVPPNPVHAAPAILLKRPIPAPKPATKVAAHPPAKAVHPVVRRSAATKPIAKPVVKPAAAKPSPVRVRFH
jgi:hypothetical protein